MYVTAISKFLSRPKACRFQVVKVPNPLLFVYESDVSCTEYVSTSLENEAKTSSRNI